MCCRWRAGCSAADDPAPDGGYYGIGDCCNNDPDDEDPGFSGIMPPRLENDQESLLNWREVLWYNLFHSASREVPASLSRDLQW